MERQAGELTVLELARLLDMPQPTLFSWLRRASSRDGGLVCGHPIWLIRADEAELERLKGLREAPPRQSLSFPTPVDF